MNKISKGIILTLIMMSGYGYADNMPSLATTGFVQGAYTQLKNEISAMQDNIPMVSRPTSGRHTLIWDGDIGQFIFEQTPEPLNCSNGLFNIGMPMCVNPEPDAIRRGYINDGRNPISGPMGLNIEEYGLSQDNSWGVTFDYGKIVGVASCNGTQGDHNNREWTNPTTKPSNSFDTNSQGIYCWCKMTSPAVSLWVITNSYEKGYEWCANDCASYCGFALYSFPEFRVAMFKAVSK